MRFPIKKSVALLGAAAMMVSVAACGSDNASTSDNSGSKDGKSTVTVWSWDTTINDAAEAS